MANTCIVCGKSFKPKRWNQQTCSEDCKNKRQYQFWLSYQKEHSKKEKPKTKKKVIAKSTLKVLEGDPKWIRDYAKGDRLTQISMLARALSDMDIIKLSYGELALWWNTDRYYAWEKNVISRKRKEQAYANKDTFKDIFQIAAEDRAKEKDSTEEQ